MEPDGAVARTDREVSLLPYFVVTALLTLGYGSIFTLLADLRDRFGLRESELGLIAGAGFLAGFLAQVGLARYADRGHSRVMVITGVAVASVAMVGMALSSQAWHFVAARFALGLGSGALGPALRRVVIARDPDRVGENLGRMAAFDVGGFVLGPIVAGVCAQFGGVRAAFWFLALLTAALLPLVVRLDLASGGVDRERRTVRDLLRRRPLLAALATIVCFQVTLGTFEAVWAVLLADNGADTWLIGLSLSLFVVPMVALAPVAGRLAQERGPLRTATVGIAVAIPCTLLYGLTGNLGVLLAVSLVHAAADGITMPSNQVAVALSSPADQLASAQGLAGAVGLVVAGGAAAVGARVYETAGAATLFGGAAVIMALSLGTAWVLGGASLGRPGPASRLVPADEA